MRGGTGLLRAAVKPGVDLADAGLSPTAPLGRGLAGGSFLLGRAHGARLGGEDGFGLAARLDLEPVEPGLKLRLAGEGLALAGAGAETIHLVAMLIGLPAALVDGLSRPRWPGLDLGLDRDRRGGQCEQGEEGPDHAMKMVSPAPISKRGRNRSPGVAVEKVGASRRRVLMTRSITDPGFSRDPELEEARGTGRPAASEMSGEDHSDDPAPERHIHFSPDPEAPEVIAPGPTSWTRPTTA